MLGQKYDGSPRRKKQSGYVQDTLYMLCFPSTSYSRVLSVLLNVDCVYGLSFLSQTIAIQDVLCLIPNHCHPSPHILQNKVSGFHVSCFPEVLVMQKPVTYHSAHSPCILLLLWKTASLLSTEFGLVQNCLMLSSRYQLWFSSTRVNMITNSRSTSVLVPEYLFRTPLRNIKSVKKKQLEVN